MTKMTTCMTIKRGCQCNFVVKQVYIDTSLYELQYHCQDHVTVDGKLAQGIAFD
jgi:hypothetical protein